MELKLLKEEYIFKTWSGPIGITNFNITRLLGFYLFIISIVLLFIYWIIMKKEINKRKIIIKTLETN